MLVLDCAGDGDPKSLTFREALPRPVAWFLLATAITFTAFTATMSVWVAGDVPQWITTAMFGMLTVLLYLVTTHVFRYERVVVVDGGRGVVIDRKRTVFGTTCRELPRARLREVLSASEARTFDEAWIVTAGPSAEMLHMARAVSSGDVTGSLGSLVSELIGIPLTLRK